MSLMTWKLCKRTDAWKCQNTFKFPRWVASSKVENLWQVILHPVFHEYFISKSSISESQPDWSKYQPSKTNLVRKMMSDNVYRKLLWANCDTPSFEVTCNFIVNVIPPELNDLKVLWRHVWSLVSKSTFVWPQKRRMFCIANIVLARSFERERLYVYVILHILSNCTYN